MEQPKGIRTVGVLLALLLVAGPAGDAFGLHDCPLHHHDDGHRNPVSGTLLTGPPPHAPSGHHHRASHGGPHGDGETHLCSCVGSCHPGSSHPLLSPGTGASPVGMPEASRAPALPTLRRPQAPVAYLLPYPLGPPGR